MNASSNSHRVGFASQQSRPDTHGRDLNGSSVVQSSVESGDNRGELPPTPPPPAKRPRLGTASSRKPTHLQAGQVQPTERPQLDDSRTQRREPGPPACAEQANPSQSARPSTPPPHPDPTVVSVVTTTKEGDKKGDEHDYPPSPPAKRPMGNEGVWDKMFPPRPGQTPTTLAPETATRKRQKPPAGNNQQTRKGGRKPVDG
jgi:hypothetical protein